jgi:HTH-type transcriptional repressor of NAD biosynthesis genes
MKYKIGMYGGKFMPFHKGHRYCVETASNECEKVYVILFYGGADEIEILKNNNSNYLSVEIRKQKVIELTSNYPNAIPIFIDVTNCRLDNGKEDWDAETPLVRNVVGDTLNAVYSSEESYGDYFSRAYPEAVHRLVDVKRKHYPISGTMIRNMKRKEEREEWMV